jgi:membrane protein
MPFATQRASSVVRNLRRRADELQQWAQRTLLWRVWERMLETEFIDRSVALGAKAFVSFFPTIIVIAAFSPSSVRSSILETITHRAGLSGTGLVTVRNAFATADDTRKATGIIGLLFTLFYINSFTTALGRIYTRAWRRPPAKQVARYGIGVGWLMGILVYFVIIGAVRSIFGSGPGTAGFAVVALAASIGLWWVTPRLMLQREVRFRVLAPTAVLTGIAASVYAASATVWMPTTVSKNQAQFGFFGVALSLVTWLTGVATIVVVCACVAPVVADDNGVIGRLTRGAGRSDVLMPGVQPSLPPPTREPTFADALGLRDDDTEPNET